MPAVSSLSQVKASAAGERCSWRGSGQGALSRAKVNAFVAADWSLTGADARSNLHPYPARFVLGLPAQAIKILLPSVGVIDPFCGSGTTNEASAAAGLPSVGVDLNPIACLLSRVRVSKWLPGDLERGHRYANDVVDAAKNVSDDVVEKLRVSIPRVDHWFEPWAQRLLAGATHYLQSFDPHDPWCDRVALSISASVVKLSRQDSDTRYAAVRKGLDEYAGLAVLRSAVEQLAARLGRRSPLLTHDAMIFERDARDLAPIADESLDAAIFSPPYPNAYEYWLYHKYRMYWLQHDPIAVREAEIGARPHYFKARKPHTEIDFANQMSDVFKELSRVLRPRSPVVIVVGDSVIHGRLINNRELLFDAARHMGFLPRGATVRGIVRSRSSFNSAHGKGRNTEHILLLESPA